MYVNQDLCIGCGLCVPYCPVGAISVSNRKAVIDRDVCVECSCCQRSKVCRKDALTSEELKMPRGIRSTMSDVLTAPILVSCFLAEIPAASSTGREQGRSCSGSPAKNKNLL